MNHRHAYIDFLKSFVNVAKPLTVVLDGSNGPAGALATEVLANTPVTTISIHTDIDPDFKDHGPNPLLPGALESSSREIQKHGADLGIVFDADGDRAIFLDNQGNPIPACFIALLLAKQYPPPFVLDELVYHSVRLLQPDSIANMLPSRIGAYFIKELMRQEQASGGAEFSGHYYFQDFFNADSGILAGILVLNTLATMNQNLADWKASYGEYLEMTTELRLPRVEVASLYQTLETQFASRALEVSRRDGVTFLFPKYWINIRASNTEPLLRIIGGGSREFASMLREIEQVLTTSQLSPPNPQ